MYIPSACARYVLLWTVTIKFYFIYTVVAILDGELDYGDGCGCPYSWINN